MDTQTAQKNLTAAQKAHDAARARVGELETKKRAAAADPKRFAELGRELIDATLEVDRTSLVLDAAQADDLEARLAEKRTKVRALADSYRSTLAGAKSKARELAGALQVLNEAVVSISESVTKAQKIKAETLALAQQIGESVDKDVSQRDERVDCLTVLFVELQKKRLRATRQELNDWAGHLPPITRRDLYEALRNLHSLPFYIPPHSDDAKAFDEEAQIEAIVSGTYYERMREISDNRKRITEEHRQAERKRLEAEFTAEVAAEMKRHSVSKREAEQTLIQQGRYPRDFATA